MSLPRCTPPIPGIYLDLAGKLMLDTSPGSQILVEARDQFLASLSDGERASFSKCSSIEEFLLDVGKLEVISTPKRRGAKFLTQIKRLSDRLQPCFKGLDLLAQSDQWSAIAWGVFRLVLQLASNYVVFFEKLTKVIERVAAALPQYEQFMEIFGSGASERLKTSLCQVYVDLFEFFEGVARVFTKKNGTVKRTPVVIGELFWKPFDSRFQDTLDKFEFHQELVKGEVTLSHYKLSQDAREAEAEERQEAASTREQIRRSQIRVEEANVLADEERKEHSFHRMKAWLAPTAFMQELEHAQELREEDTAEWVFDEPNFVRWKTFDSASELQSNRAKPNNGTLWIHGNPGCGKTVLAGSIVEELRTMEGNDAHSRVVLCYFFFNRNDPMSTISISALRPITAQILQQSRQDNNLLDKISFSMADMTGGQMVASQSELVELLRVCLQCLPKVYIVLDAIDECEDNQALIRNLSKTSIGSSAKILFLSRPNVASLRTAVTDDCRVTIDEQGIRRDIELYLSRKIDLLLSEGLLCETSAKAELLAHLVLGADGMFLWARLMVVYLNSPGLTRAQRLRTFKEVKLPEGLDAMYKRILSLIGRASSAEQDLARKVFLWLSNAKSELNKRELCEAVTTVNEANDDNEREYGDFEHAVVMSCAGLVESTRSDSTRSQGYFRYIHLSVQEYFSSYFCSTRHQQCQELSNLGSLVSARGEAHMEMARSCLFYLTYRTPAQPLSGKLGTKSSPHLLDQNFPFLRYASLHWIYHLHEISIILKDLDSSEAKLYETTLQNVDNLLSSFISKRFVVMAWIEARYTFTYGGHGTSIDNTGLREWSVCSESKPVGRDEYDNQKLSQDVMDFYRDLLRIHDEWGVTLYTHPDEIWGSIAAFTPSRFLAPNSSTTVSSLVPKPLEGTTYSSSPLCTISQGSSSGAELAVLSVWPSRAYERVWQCLKSAGSCFILKPVCSGWVVRYEIWTVEGEPCRLQDLYIPLDKSEVWMQVRQSTRQQISGSWRMQFPITISNNVSLFAVLRTIFIVRRDEGEVSTELAYAYAVLPLGFHEKLQYNWSDNKMGFGPVKHMGQSALHQIGTHSIYEYSLKFALSGEYLIFRDAFIIAVFKVQTTHNRFNVVLYRHIISKNDGFLLGVGKFAMHPYLPVVVFGTPYAVTLWKLEPGEL
ncbi:MAG: hypothetical protein Q9187_002326 [Circinaria calcarea]